MNSYERLVAQMRRQGAHDNDYPPALGVVLSGKKVKMDDLILKPSDYLISSGLSISADDKVVVLRIGQEFVVIAKVVST
jgi:hypothetical protein